MDIHAKHVLEPSTRYGDVQTEQVVAVAQVVQSEIQAEQVIGGPALD